LIRRHHTPLPSRGLICIVTDRRRLCPEGSLQQQRRALEEQASAAAQARVDLFQLRERDLPDGALFETTRAVLEATAGTPLRVIVNDRPDVALAAGAAGVQLRADGVSAADARQLGPDWIVGCSVHSAEEAERAAAGGADFVLFGTVFPTTSKPSGHRAAGVPALASAVRAASRVPVLAIGGVSPGNVMQVANAGAAGVAAIGWFALRDGRRMRAAVEECRRAFDRPGNLI
jgi:thiamine-phosphate pyrophosphorylase